MMEVLASDDTTLVIGNRTVRSDTWAYYTAERRSRGLRGDSIGTLSCPLLFVAGQFVVDPSLFMLLSHTLHLCLCYNKKYSSSLSCAPSTA